MSLIEQLASIAERRVFKKNKLFALEETQTSYPGYEDAMLLNDLRQKSGIVKSNKKTQVLDLRRCINSYT